MSMGSRSMEPSRVLPTPACIPPSPSSLAVDQLTETGAHRCCQVPTAVLCSLLTPSLKRDSLRCDTINAAQGRTCVKTCRGLLVR